MWVGGRRSELVIAADVAGDGGLAALVGGTPRLGARKAKQRPHLLLRVGRAEKSPRGPVKPQLFLGHLVVSATMQ